MLKRTIIVFTLICSFLHPTMVYADGNQLISQGTTVHEAKARNGFVAIGKDTFYYVNGKIFKGQKKINGYWYYFHEKDGHMVKGFVTIPKTYNKAGAKYVYCDSKGHMAFGRKKIGNYYYLFDSKSGQMLKGWHTYSGKKMYFNSKGQQLFGTYKIGNYYYHFNPKDSGALVTGNGWKTVNGKTYYVNSKGQLTIGSKKIDGFWYTFDSKTGAVDNSSFYVKKINYSTIAQSKLSYHYSLKGDVHNTVDSAAKQLRQAMNQNKPVTMNIAIKSKKNVYELGEDIANEASKFNDGKYLIAIGHQTVQEVGKSLSKNGTLYATIKIIWLQNDQFYKWDQIARNEVRQLIVKNKVKQMSEIDKLKWINDWITENVKYDYNHRKNPSHEVSLAYGAIHNRKAICGGIAQLVCIMCDELGIDCRYVQSKYHAWNVVRYKGKYYYFDATTSLTSKRTVRELVGYRPGFLDWPIYKYPKRDGFLKAKNSINAYLWEDVLPEYQVLTNRVESKELTKW